MSLIVCSECGANISEKAVACPKCGCPTIITKQAIQQKKKEKKYKTIQIVQIAVYIAGILIVLGVGITAFITSRSPYCIAVKRVKNDFEKNVQIESVYYNDEVNGCIVKFVADGKRDVATVHLDKKVVGYESVMNEYTAQSNQAKTNEEKRKCAQTIVNYGNFYDIMWYYNLLMYGESSGWKKINLLTVIK